MCSPYWNVDVGVTSCYLPESMASSMSSSSSSSRLTTRQFASNWALREDHARVQLELMATVAENLTLSYFDLLSHCFPPVRCSCPVLRRGSVSRRYVLVLLLLQLARGWWG